MLRYIVYLDRSKRAKANVQRNLSDADTLIPNLF